MFHKIDDFLIDRVFQPAVIALGVEVKTLVRVQWLLLIAVQFGKIAMAWSGRAEIDLAGILLVAICTWRLQSGVAAYGRLNPIARFVRVWWLGFVIYDVCIVALLAADGRASLATITSILLMAIEFVSVCRDPPPKGRFAFSGA